MRSIFFFQNKKLQNKSWLLCFSKSYFAIFFQINTFVCFEIFSYTSVIFTTCMSYYQYGKQHNPRPHRPPTCYSTVRSTPLPAAVSPGAASPAPPAPPPRRQGSWGPAGRDAGRAPGLRATGYSGGTPGAETDHAHPGSAVGEQTMRRIYIFITGLHFSHA